MSTYFETNMEREFFESKLDQDIENEIIEREMHRCKEDGLRKLSILIAHSHVEEVAACLAYSYFDSQEYAQKIANDLDLGKMEFLAIQEEFEAFKRCYLRNLEYSLSF